MFALIVALVVLVLLAIALGLPELRAAMRVMKCQRIVNKAVKDGTLRRL